MGQTILEALIFLLQLEVRRTTSAQEQAKARDLVAKLEAILAEEPPEEPLPDEREH